jgi:hypothetical protein
MLDYVLIIAVFGLCILFGAWKEYANGNVRDSRLMAGIGVCAWLGSAGVLWTTT